MKMFDNKYGFLLNKSCVQFCVGGSWMKNIIIFFLILILIPFLLKVVQSSFQATGRFKGFGFVVFEEVGIHGNSAKVIKEIHMKVSGFAGALAEPDQTFKGGRSVSLSSAHHQHIHNSTLFRSSSTKHPLPVL